MSRFKFDAIGTAWEIETPSPLEMTARRRILDTDRAVRRDILAVPVGLAGLADRVFTRGRLLHLPGGLDQALRSL